MMGHRERKKGEGEWDCFTSWRKVMCYMKYASAKIKTGFNKSEWEISVALAWTGWRMFRQMLEYKCEDYGKNLLVIGRFDASSKTCNVCGSVYHKLGRDEKEWICKDCKAKHDRDINAAINIKKFGYRKYELGQCSESLDSRTSGALA